MLAFTLTLAERELNPVSPEGEEEGQERPHPKDNRSSRLGTWVSDQFLGPQT